MVKYMGNVKSRAEPGKDHEKSQDYHTIGSNFCIIADGVTGKKAGDVAAKAVVDYLEPRLTQESESWNSENVDQNLVSLLADANKYVRKLGQKKASTRDMRASALIVLIVGDEVYFAPVGDCGAYVITNDGELEKMTEEQTHTSLLVKRGIVGKNALYTHPTRAMLTGSIGMEKDPKVKVTSKPLSEIKYLLAASDGILKYVPEEDIEDIFENCESLEDALNMLFKIWASPEKVSRMHAEVDKEKTYDEHLEAKSREDDATAIIMENMVEGSQNE